MPTSHLPRLVVFASGNGSNLQALLDATASGSLAARVVLVVSDRRAAFALERAAQAHVPALYLPFTPYTISGQDRAAYDTDLADQVSIARPHLVVLAGWLRILGPQFLDRFPGQVINLHPALPGRFPGLHAIERAYTEACAGQLTESGCMVHYAVPEVDAGPVICQASVPVHSTDTLAQFMTRMHAAEHRLIVEGVQRALADQAARLPSEAG